MQGVVIIKKHFQLLYFKLINLINKKYDCLHRIIFIVSALAGGFFFYYISKNDLLSAALSILLGGIVVEFINKYLKKQPEVILVTQAKGEKDEEFIKKIQNKLKDTINEKKENEEK